MANKKQITPKEFQNKILELESIYGTKKLGQKLGVSRDSIRRYRTGKTTPKDKSIYTKINRIYGQKKKSVNQEQVQKIKERQKKQSMSQRFGRLKSQYAPLYPDYMYESPVSEFKEAKNFELFDDLSMEGFIAGWKGRDSEGIPLEVQFLAEGKVSLSRFGRIVNIVTVVTEKQSPKGRSWRPEDQEGTDSIRVFKIYYRSIPGLTKKKTFFQRMDLIRDYILETKIERGHIEAFIGYYFNEGDEI